MAAAELKLGDRGDEVRSAQDLMNRIGMLLEADGVFGKGTEAAVRDTQSIGKLPVTGRLDEATWTWLRAQPEPSPVITTRAVVFIVKEEVGSRSYYASRAARPTYPGGQSGITIGVGYDLRFQTAEDFNADWGAVLTQTQLDALTPFVGRQGSDDAARGLNALTIPWQAAWTVFIQRLLPNYVARTRDAFPGFDRLTGLSRGVLVSLVYNRGAKMTGDDRKEMRDIRDAVETGNLTLIPDAILSMKRLWPDSEGLRQRRDREAALFREGLQARA